MTESGSESATTPKKQVPYPAWSAFNAFMARLKEKGVPAHIDRAFIGGSGTNQSAMQQALRLLGLITDSGVPTERLRDLATADSPEQLAALYGEALNEVYGEALALGMDASQGQLEAWLRTRQVQGDTARKAQSFYQALAKAADTPLSPFFKSPRASTPKRKTNGRRTSEVGDDGSGGGGTNQQTQVTKAHPAVVALLDKLPAPGDSWSRKDRDLLVAAFGNVVDLFHPTTD